MDDALNVTYVTIAGFVELHRYRYLYWVIMFMVYVLILGCNSTIVLLIAVHKTFHQPMFIFIAALLLNSVLYSSTIYPKLLLDFLSEEQLILYPLCLLQSFLYYTTVGSEFLLLAAMSYDRYVSICQPLLYPSIMRRSTISVFLLLAWLLPVCELSVVAVIYANLQLCSFTLKGIFCNTSVYSLQCAGSPALAMYSVFVLVNVAVLPLLFILFTYARILLVAYRSCRAVRRKAAHTCLPHLLILISLSCFVTYDVVIVRLNSSFPKTARLIMTLQMIAYHPLLNPIIYGLKMKEIKKHLKMIFTHRNNSLCHQQ